jgi:DNA-binding protein H-NS
MAIAALKRMDVFELISLRDKVVARIAEVRRDLERRLSRLDGKAKLGRPAGNRRDHALKGKKVAPKYRGPDGETWTGRGLKPRWLTAAIETGSKIEDFLIATVGKPVRKTKAKKK